jgi:hypothetical protein
MSRCKRWEENLKAANEYGKIDEVIADEGGFSGLDSVFFDEFFEHDAPTAERASRKPTA